MNYKIFISSSDSTAITNLLKIAIQAADTKLVGIDLGLAGGWWPTRLYLLAALLAEYTSVAKIVFSDKTTFLGTCGLKETQRAIGHAFPAISKAIADSLLPQHGFDRAQDVEMVVQAFSQKMDMSGGEAQYSQPILPHVVRDFDGFSKDRIEFEANRDQVTLQREVLRKRHQYVAIEDPPGSVTIVDRLLFASRVAELAINKI